MKRTNFILNGFLALAIVLVFAQCSDNNNAATSSTAPAVGVAGSSNMKIALTNRLYPFIHRGFRCGSNCGSRYESKCLPSLF